VGELLTRKLGFFPIYTFLGRVLSEIINVKNKIFSYFIILKCSALVDSLIKYKKISDIKYEASYGP
jgi:hypothetical protein